MLLESALSAFARAVASVWMAAELLPVCAVSWVIWLLSAESAVARVVSSVISRALVVPRLDCR